MSPSIPDRSERLELEFPEGVTLVLGKLGGAAGRESDGKCRLNPEVPLTETWPTIFRRFLAFAVDWLILAAWGGVVFAIVMLAADGEPGRPSGPWMAQAIGFAAITLPFTLYFTVCEFSRRHASVGKRVFALTVLRRSHEPMSLARAFLRNAIKFAPWECGHTLAQQAIYAGDEGMPVWVWGPAVIAAIGPLWWIVSLLASGDTPYDHWVDARVSRRRPTSAPSGPPG